jgi:hypothetical protein
VKGRKLIFDHGAKRPLIALLLRKSISIDMTPLLPSGPGIFAGIYDKKDLLFIS